MAISTSDFYELFPIVGYYVPTRWDRFLGWITGKPPAIMVIRKVW